MQSTYSDKNTVNTNSKQKQVVMSGSRKDNILKKKLMSFNQTVKIKTSETCIGA
jgi:hypothetical protein